MRFRALGSTGVSVSVIGFGASPLGDVFHQTDPEEGKRAVSLAIQQGINLFDVSPYYGKTLAEERLGIALQGRRDKVFLATKCGRYDADFFDFSAARIEKSIEESLRRLRTDHLDLLQAHDVEFGDLRQIVEVAILTLQKLKQSGKVRFVGITGYSLGMLRKIAEQANIDTILSYCRYNPLITDLDVLLTPSASELKIGLINASPLHMGVLTERGAPPWHPAPLAVKEAGSRVVQLCKQQGLDPSIVALRFCLDHPYTASTLVGMSSTKHVMDNLRALDTAIDPALLAQMRQIVEPVKDTLWPSGRLENADTAVATTL